MEDQKRKRGRGRPGVTCPQVTNPPSESLTNGYRSNASNNQTQPPRLERFEILKRSAPFSKMLVGGVHPQSTTDDLITFDHGFITENDVMVQVGSDEGGHTVLKSPLRICCHDCMYEVRWPRLPRGIYNSTSRPFVGAQPQSVASAAIRAWSSSNDALVTSTTHSGGI